MADDDQVMPVRARVVGDDLGGMAGHQLSRRLDAPPPRLLSRPLEDAPEALVLRALDLIDLAERGGTGRQPAFDRPGGEPRAERGTDGQGASSKP